MSLIILRNMLSCPSTAVPPMDQSGYSSINVWTVLQFSFISLSRTLPAQILFITQSKAKQPSFCGNSQRSPKPGCVPAYSMISVCSAKNLQYWEYPLCTDFSQLFCEVFSRLICILLYSSDHLNKHWMNGSMKEENHNFSFTLSLRVS